MHGFTLRLLGVHLLDQARCMEAYGARCSKIRFAVFALHQDVLLSPPQPAWFCVLSCFLLTSTLSSLPTSVFACYFSPAFAILRLFDCSSHRAAFRKALLVAFRAVLDCAVLVFQRQRGPPFFPPFNVVVGILAAPSTSSSHITLAACALLPRF